MTARRRSQPHRFQWPLNAQQLQDIDDTFQILFDEMKRIDDEQDDPSFIPAHATTHGSSGSDPVTIAESQVVGLTADLASKVPNTRQVISGAGLTGGGDLSVDRTLAVGAGTGITVNADDVALDTASTRNTDHAAVVLTAGAGLTGGGDITASRTFAVGAGTNIASNADDVAVTPQPGAASKLLGRGDSGAGAWEVISLGSGVSMTGTTLSATGTGSNALLDGSNHTDTVAQAVSRGSLIYGNATPKWDELTVGGAGTVLSSDGTDVSWQPAGSGSGYDYCQLQSFVV
jgi:hypothetical protein